MARARKRYALRPMADAIPEPARRPSPVRKPVFYALDSSKVTVREYWWGTPALAMPVAMLFVRCRGGLSHHPEEYAGPRDIAVALRVLVDFLRTLR